MSVVPRCDLQVGRGEDVFVAGGVKKDLIFTPFTPFRVRNYGYGMTSEAPLSLIFRGMGQLITECAIPPGLKKPRVIFRTGGPQISQTSQLMYQ